MVKWIHPRERISKLIRSISFYTFLLGKTREFSSGVFSPVVFCALFLVFSIAAITGCSSQPHSPNVLVLTMDTLRADALGCYGAANVKTPNLDKLAKEGVLFEDAVCQIPATLTSHTAIFTGRNPKSTGVRFRTAAVPATEETLAERFQSRGYQTAAFLSSYVLAPEFGLNQGFDRYDLGSIKNGKSKAADERRAEETIDQAINFLKNKSAKPFFLWIHLYDPHSPYNPPAPYSAMYDPNYTGTINGTVSEVARLNANRGKGASPRDLHHLRALYNGEVAYMDFHIGRLVTAMREIEILDNTIVAALADHGENLGENGRFFHGDDLYQPAVHIPFLLRYPKRIPQSMRIRQTAQSIDLFPTLLELASVPSVSGVEGSSILPLIDQTRQSSQSFKEKPAYLETEADTLADCNKLYGVRVNAHKFIYKSAHRRADVPLGVFTEIPLKGPTLVMLRIQGDPAVRFMAHVRYRTKELYQSRDFQALAALNTTIVHAETAGVEPLQQQAIAQGNFLPTPPDWRLQMTPDIYRIARDYGESQGWPVDWMVLEGVGVDASLPANRSEGTFTVDQIELYAPALRFPNSPQFRSPFWVIENFEEGEGLADSGEGAPHSIRNEWTNQPIFGGKRQQKIVLSFEDEIDCNALDELYRLSVDPHEQTNRLQKASLKSEDAQVADRCRSLLNSWMARAAGLFEPQTLDASQLEALQALGYSK